MGVAMDFNWRRLVTAGEVVGWETPVLDKNGNPTVQGWHGNERCAYDAIHDQAAPLAEVGFTAFRFPPSPLGGAGIFSDGYDKNNDYCLDGTAFGDAEQLRRAVAACHAQGMQAYGDLVLHQYGGSANGVYDTPRFPKHPSCFVGDPPRVAVDPVPDSTGNFPFGDMCSYLNSTPGGYMYFGALAATKWLRDTTDFDGFRIDDAKGTYVGVQLGIIEHLVATGLELLGWPKYYFNAEYFDGNSYMVGRYVYQLMQGKISVLDIAFKFNVSTICNNNSRAWMGQLANIGWCIQNASTAVTAVEDADTDTGFDEQCVWNKILGYAIMLTFPGYPTVYWRDYSTDEYCYGLKPWIDNLVWIHEHLAQGAFVPRLDSHPQVFAHERLGYGDAPGCICFFNNDQYNTYTVTVQTRHPPNTRLHQYAMGYQNDEWATFPDKWTDSNGCLTVTVPTNNNGHSYLMYAPWITPEPFAPVPIYTTQMFFGDKDLTNMPALKPGTNVVGRVYCAEGSELTTLLLAADANPTESSITGDQAVVLDPNGNILPITKQANLAQEGWYTLQIEVPETNILECGYELQVYYLGA